MTENWSKHWKNSKKPRKQRKYQANAPHHQQKQFLNAGLSDNLTDKVGTNTLPVRTGDHVKVLRGDFSGKQGEVSDVNRETHKLYVEGISRETVSGSKTQIAVDPSNVMLTQLNLDDDQRIAKYDLSEADKEEIRAETAEVEEAEEEEAETEGESEQEDTDSSESVDYEALVEENVDDVKDRVRDSDLDAEKVLAAEKENKNRSTLVDWLENRIEGDSNDE